MQRRRDDGARTAPAEVRSALMSRIGGRHTDPELVLRRELWRRGLRYRLHVRTPAGRPDIVFPRARIAVFVDGCFWHGCPLHYVRPRSGSSFWGRKLRDNVLRDQRQTAELEDAGWLVLRFWEHEVYTRLPSIASEVEQVLKNPRAHRPGRRWQVVAVEPLPGWPERERRILEEVRRSAPRRVERRTRTTTKW